MKIRGFSLALIVFLIIAVAASFPSTQSDQALAQTSRQSLSATVEALQTHVADQDDRIAHLESEVSAIHTVLAGAGVTPEPITATPDSAEANDIYTITGTLMLLAESSRTVQENQLDENFFWTRIDGQRTCIGSGGFDDLGGGMEVVVSDGSGNTLAVNQTAGGTFDVKENACVFAFRVDVSASDFYDVRIGRREGPTYTFADLEAAGWEINLSID